MVALCATWFRPEPAALEHLKKRLIMRNVPAPLVLLFLVDLSFFKVTRTIIKSLMSSKFDQIISLTAGVASLECLK